MSGAAPAAGGRLRGEPGGGGPAPGLTIGQLAAYAGVTIKAVRHYHRRGLLPEPPRDASGYRRYGAAHAIALVKIKTLAEAGVPLARVEELLAAGPDHFAAALAELDRALQHRAAALRRTRARLARLGAGDRLFVSAAVADFLDRLRELGVSPRSVQAERDLWILMQAAAPEAAAGWIADKRDALGDPEFRALYLACDAALGWAPDDPRLAALADRARRWLAARGGQSAGDAGPVRAPDIARLAATLGGAAAPAWVRLTAIAPERQGRQGRQGRPAEGRTARRRTRPGGRRR